jgi:hypothetical protein
MPVASQSPAAPALGHATHTRLPSDAYRGFHWVLSSCTCYSRRVCAPVPAATFPTLRCSLRPKACHCWWDLAVRQYYFLGQLLPWCVQHRVGIQRCVHIDSVQADCAHRLRVATLYDGADACWSARTPRATPDAVVGSDVIAWLASRMESSE